ncbi:hypothetical protein DNTS_013739 [Danionella cerebrum]|uniref:Transmembrane protein 174 n=1 Tax=Danionella cerebrum TaxID=2873325 RepID=A0A553R213_9TELE|nr:hypothetical protein DNTS_013739 [Danionella translucida]
MEHLGILNIWSITKGRSRRASSLTRPRDPTTAGANVSSNDNQTHSDPPVNVVSLVPSQTRSSSESQVSDGDKAGATLLFSGVFLGLVGITFTAMGWTNNTVSHKYDWTQLLGPILLSVGGTFVLISICKFRMLACLSCKKIDGEDSLDADPLPPLSGPSFVFTRFNQPITFHSATVVQYIPPPYVEQDRCLGSSNGLHSNHQPLAVTTSSPPQYYNVYPMGNPDFIPGEQNTTLEQPENRSFSLSVGEEKSCEREGDSDSACAPPAYDELFAPSQGSSVHDI